MKIHCIETGKVKVKKNQMRKATGLLPGTAKIIFDQEWSDWLPIYAWVVEHPEGIFVVDTGETSRVHNPGYFPAWHPYYRTSVKFDLKPEDEIGPQLMRSGIDPAKDVSTVILTHFHTDHTGGMHHFEHSRFLVHQDAYKNAKGLKGLLAGNLPHRWPEWFDPDFLEFHPAPLGPFTGRHFLTSDGKISVLHTPGHVENHVSVAVEMNGIIYFLAGDTSYNQQNMLEEHPDGVGNGRTAETLRKIKSLCRERQVVYLPSHDPDAGKRLRHDLVADVDDYARVA